MHVFVAFKALSRCSGEINGGLGGTAFRPFGPVTARARNALVRLFEYELSRGVIEGPQFFPLPNVMASLAREGRAMRVGVAGDAGLRRKVILARCGGGRSRQRLMTIHAQHRGVRAR